MVCFSESFESLSEGMESALWTLGAVPRLHRTDRLSTAIQKPSNQEEFTVRYRALLRHYGMEGQATQAASPNENGDVEQRNNRIKRAVDQSLMIRGSRDFESRKDYERFLKKLFLQLNAGRKERLLEEMRAMRSLPARRLESCKRMDVRVHPSSIIRVNGNVYSVSSRLIGEWVQVRLLMEHLEVWYGQRLIEKIPRLRGDDKHRVDYRHIIDWLVRKPGAFESYRYREDLFPTFRFRMAYDALKRTNPLHASKEYLKILHLAARESEVAVDRVLWTLLDRELPISFAAVEEKVRSREKTASPTEVAIPEVDLCAYDALLDAKEAYRGGN
jgi:hypothetical protein